MAIEVPSFWDYLGQGIQQGHESFTAARKKKADEAKEAAGFMTQLYGTGAVDSSALQGALGSVPGLPPGVRINPSQQELGRTPGTQEFQKKAAAATVDRQTLDDDKALQDWTAGKPITEHQALRLKLPTSQDMAQMREAKADPILEKAGTQYIDQAVLGQGGRISPAQAAQLVDKAYQQYASDYKQAGLGTLNSQQLGNAKRYFSSRAMALLVKQREDDTNRIRASNVGTSGIQPQDRMFTQLTSLMESNRKTLDDFLGANPGIDKMASMPDDKIKPFFKGVIARYRRLIQREEDLQNAQHMLAAGIMPKDFSNLLTSSVGGGFDETKVSQALEALKAGGKLSDLAGQVSLGRLSSSDAAEVRRRVGSIDTTVTTRRPSATK